MAMLGRWPAWCQLSCWRSIGTNGLLSGSKATGISGSVVEESHGRGAVASGIAGTGNALEHLRVEYRSPVHTIARPMRSLGDRRRRQRPPGQASLLLGP
jgi:hypothetical protein